jgi:hypothetical protein
LRNPAQIAASHTQEQCWRKLDIELEAARSAMWVKHPLLEARKAAVSDEWLFCAGCSPWGIDLVHLTLRTEASSSMP